MNSVSYLKSKAAAILWFVQFIIGIAAVYFMYSILKPIIPVFREIGKQAELAGKGISAYTQYLAQYPGVSGELARGLEVILRDIDGITWFTMISVITILFYLLISQVLVVIDAIGATLLLFKSRGTRCIQVIHGIHAAVCILLAADIILSMIMLPKNSELMTADMIIGFEILMGISAFLYFLMFCYHKDIIMVMKTISLNIKKGRADRKKNHLSGLSILGGLAFTVLLLASIKIMMEFSDAWILPVICAVLAVKQFMIAACNRKVKQFNRKE